MAVCRPVHNRFDQLGKQIGCEALGPSGVTVAHDEISPDAQHADLRHEPDPAREGERSRLGLLGRLASLLCLMEIYSGAPDDEEVLACVGKLIAFRQKRLRSFRKKRAHAAPGEKIETFVRPFLWIITAGRPTGVLDELGDGSASGWPQGIYFSPGPMTLKEGGPIPLKTGSPTSPERHRQEQLPPPRRSASLLG